MLTTKQAADYRSVAGSVHTQLIQARLQQGDKPFAPADRYARQRLHTIKDLLQVGKTFARNADGSLDRGLRSTTPEKLSLARELTGLVPKKLPDYQDDSFDMKRWTERAVNILERLEAGQGVGPTDVKFVEVELQGFLENLLRLPPDVPRKVGSSRLR
jgi:hypothetical protein